MVGQSIPAGRGRLATVTGPSVTFIRDRAVVAAVAATCPDAGPRSGNGSGDQTAGAATGPSRFSMAKPTASSLVSVSTGPSMSMPTGIPVGVRPAGRERLGTPATLPGPMFRMVVAKVSTCGPPSTDMVLEPLTVSIGAGSTGEVGNMIASTALTLK